MEIISGENFRRRSRELVRKKSAIKADDDFAFRAGDGIRAPKIRRRLRDARDVRKRKILRDDCAPAVRAEFDLCHAPSLAKDSLYAKHCGS